MELPSFPIQHEIESDLTLILAILEDTEENYKRLKISKLSKIRNGITLAQKIKKKEQKNEIEAVFKSNWKWVESEEYITQDYIVKRFKPPVVPAGLQHIGIDKNMLFFNILSVTNLRSPECFQRDVDLLGALEHGQFSDPHMNLFDNSDCEIRDFFLEVFGRLRSKGVKVREFLDPMSKFTGYDVHNIFSFFLKFEEDLENDRKDEEEEEIDRFRMTRLLKNRYGNLLSKSEFETLDEHKRKELYDSIKDKDLSGKLMNPYRYLESYCKVCQKFFCDYHSKLRVPRLIEVINDDQLNDYSNKDFDRYFNMRYVEELKSKEGYSCEEVETRCVPTTRKCSKVSKKVVTEDQILRFLSSIEPKKLKILKILSRFGLKETCLISKLLFLKHKCYKVKAALEYFHKKFENLPKESMIMIKKSDCNLFNYVKDNGSTQTFCIQGGDCLSLCRLKEDFNNRQRLKYIHKGCSCFKCDSSCICRKRGITCLPNICKSGVEKPFLFDKLIKDLVKKKSQLPRCGNNFLICNHKKRLGLSISKVCPGLGLFALQKIEKESFLGIYIGEWITDTEQRFRDTLTEVTGSSYCFTLENGNRDGENGIGICSLIYGNKMKFINHSKDPFKNCYVKMIRGRDCVKICFFSSKKIESGEELLFDYGDNYNLGWTKYDNAISKLVNNVHNNIYGRASKRGKRRR